MKNLRTMLVLSLAIFGIICLTGCGGQKTVIEQPESVAFVIGRHACSCELNLSGRDVHDAVAAAVETEGFASIICADGDPDIIAEMGFSIDERYRHADPSLLRRDSENRVKTFLHDLSEVRADSPEVDTFEAIRLAVRTLEDGPEDANKTIYILDTGLSTTGYLSFGNNLLSADPEVIADMLEEREAIPEMQGIHVRWQHMGDVAAPQKELTPRQSNRLQEVWRTVLKRGGATFDPAGGVPNEGATEGLPEVSVLTFPKDTPIAFDGNTALDFTEPVILSDSLVRFCGDSAAYLDTAEAETVLRPIAEYMRANPDFRLLLIGSTAGDGNAEFTQRLSEDRAKAVRDTLVSLGASKSNITAMGMGTQDPWHIPGAGTESALAAQNRKVVLLDADTDTAKRLMA